MKILNFSFGLSVNAIGGDMTSIYLDREQCQKFQASYYEADKITIAADELLKSIDYDEFHRDILEPFGKKAVIASRTDEDSPGWYTVENRPN